MNIKYTHFHQAYKENSDVLKTQDFPGNELGAFFILESALPPFHVEKRREETAMGHNTVLPAGSTMK